MSKKTNKKKKQGIKLQPGQTYAVEDLQIFMHIQKTYASIACGHISDEEKATCARVLSAIDSAIKSVYVPQEGDSDEDYWN